MRKGLLLLIVAGLLAGMAATRWLTQPPELRTQNGPGQFDAERAKARLDRIIGPSPAHPADSPASDAVRARLVAELRAAGLNPRVDDRFACNGLFKQRGVSCARVRNITVTIGPAGSAPHLLVNTHYDSVPVGPGASDAGLGVAAMIEAAVLLRDRPLVRPVTFLFNEGEELGLVGARAFLEGDPLSRRVDALINLEARGTTGPVNMFETSVPNAAAVRLFQRSVEHPVANSLAVSAYRLIPNYTDVNTFVEERDWLFLNFAPIGNETRYHSPGDDLYALDLATLQHMGDQLMQTATALGSAATPEWRNGGNKLFMNLGTRWLIAFEAGTAILLGLVLLGGWWVRRLVGKDRQPLRLLPVLLAVPLLLVILLVPVALAYAGLGVVGTLREGQFWRAAPVLSELAIHAGVIAAGLALLGTAARRWTVPQLRRAWWLLFVLLGLGFSLVAPGALVYFVLPPLVFFLAAELGRRWRAAETIGALLAALLLFVTLGGAVGLFQDLLNGGPLWIFGLFGALVLMPWLIEARPLLADWRGSRIVPAALGLAALAWVPAAFAPAYSADRQQQWTLQYIVDPLQRQPVWSVVNDRKALPADWSRFGDWRLGRLPIGARQRWLAPAPPVAGIAPARALPVEAGMRPGGRRVRLRLEARGNDSVMLIAPAKATVAALGVPGQVRPINSSGSDGPYVLTCTGRSCNGQVVELWVGQAPVELMVVGTRWALPAAAATLKAAQPVHARAQYLPDSTMTVERVRI